MEHQPLAAAHHFVQDRRLVISNSRAEHGIKEIVIERKNILSSTSVAGARAGEPSVAS